MDSVSVIVLLSVLSAVLFAALVASVFVVYNLRSGATPGDRALATIGSQALLASGCVATSMYLLGLRSSGSEVPRAHLTESLAFAAVPALLLGAAAGGILYAGCRVIRSSSRALVSLGGVTLVGLSIILLAAAISAGLWLAFFLATA